MFVEIALIYHMLLPLSKRRSHYSSFDYTTYNKRTAFETLNSLTVQSKMYGFEGTTD